MKTKKELKESYKQIKPQMGVFQLKNISTNKIFIDNAIDMKSKWNRHLTELRLGSHRNHQLQSDWNALGMDSFTFEILSELKTEDNINVDYQRELKTLQNMVKEELNHPVEKMY